MVLYFGFINRRIKVDLWAHQATGRTKFQLPARANLKGPFCRKSSFLKWVDDRPRRQQQLTSDQISFIQRDIHQTEHSIHTTINRTSYSNFWVHSIEAIMAGSKRMSAEEKRKVILGIYHKTKEVYTEKEICALATKAGVNSGTWVKSSSSTMNSNVNVGGSWCPIC
jgi:hypothetical protein